jgi:hypothetical protein
MVKYGEKVCCFHMNQFQDCISLDSVEEHLVCLCLVTLINTKHNDARTIL